MRKLGVGSWNGGTAVGCLMGGTNVVAVGKSAGENRLECARTVVVPTRRDAESSSVGCLVGRM